MKRRRGEAVEWEKLPSKEENERRSVSSRRKICGFEGREEEGRKQIY